VTIAIEMSLIVLLILAIGYGFILNKKIVALRRDQKDLEKLAISFSKATQRAETGVAQLRAATQGSVTTLQEAMGKAEGIRRDLEFLIDRGAGTADKLERAVRTGERGGRLTAVESGRKTPMDTGRVMAMDERTPANEPLLGVNTRRGVDMAEKADAERQLLKALRAVR
jgi:Domain of unknown function (DUF6468)